MQEYKVGRNLHSEWTADTAPTYARLVCSPQSFDVARAMLQNCNSDFRLAVNYCRSLAYY